VDQFEQLVHPLADLRGRPLADLEPEGDIAVHREVLERRVVLEHEAHVAPLRCQAGGVPAVDRDGTGVRPLQPGDDPQQRGLAAAAGPEQRGQRSGRDGDADVAQHRAGAEGLVHVAYVDGHQPLSLARRNRVASRVPTATRASTVAVAKAARWS
jgi:hypothetical protein